MNTVTADIVFLGESGRILARGNLPGEAFIEGELDRSTKEFDLTAPVVADGKLDHFVCQSPAGETLTGRIVKNPESGLGVFAVDRLDVKAGERITGRMQALTVKERAA